MWVTAFFLQCHVGYVMGLIVISQLQLLILPSGLLLNLYCLFIDPNALYLLTHVTVIIRTTIVTKT